MVKNLGKIISLFFLLLVISILFGDFILYPVLKSQIQRPEVFAWLLIAIFVFIFIFKIITYFRNSQKDLSLSKRFLYVFVTLIKRIGISILSFVSYGFSLALAIAVIFLFLKVNSFFIH